MDVQDFANEDRGEIRAVKVVETFAVRVDASSLCAQLTCHIFFSRDTLSVNEFMFDQNSGILQNPEKKD